MTPNKYMIITLNAVTHTHIHPGRDACQRLPKLTRDVTLGRQTRLQA